jgi:hypothetical protein
MYAIGLGHFLPASMQVCRRLRGRWNLESHDVAVMDDEVVWVSTRMPVAAASPRRTQEPWYLTGEVGGSDHSLRMGLCFA